MKLNSHKLCSIAAEHRFLSFLYELDPDIFLRYRMELTKKSGCKHTQALIESTIDLLNLKGHIDKFEEFIAKNYPDCVIGQSINTIFPDYDPKVLTIPHRKILKDISNLYDYKDKLIYKYIVRDGFIYLEYLNIDEKIYVDKINWILDNYSDVVVYNQN